MTEMADRFHRSLDELVQRGARQGRRQGQKMVLRRQIARRFGEETAGKVSDVLEELPSPEGIDRVTDALFECGTGEEFIARLSRPPGVAAEAEARTSNGSGTCTET